MTCFGNWDPHFGGRGGRRESNRRWYHSKERWWLRVSSPLWPFTWENQVQDRCIDIYSRPRTCTWVSRPFHTCRRPTQSTIAAFCRYQSPGSAYQQTVELFWSPACIQWDDLQDISRIIDHISSSPQDTPVQEVFSWLLDGHLLTVSGGSSSSSAT